MKGVFMNADPSFDAKELRKYCSESDIGANIKTNPRKGTSQRGECLYFDEQLYRRRTVIEHANAWIDSFKALLVRYEKSAHNWMTMHWMAFSVLFLRTFRACLKISKEYIKGI